MKTSTSAKSTSAASKRASGATAPANPQVEERWEGQAVRGWTAFRTGVIGEARACWRSASASSRAFAPDDPRRAASGTQLALLQDVAGNAKAARAGYRRALEAWDAAEAWVERMAIDQRARSSTFHLRLRTKHAGGYDHLARAEYKRLLGAGRAATLANAAHLTKDAVDLEEARTLRVAGLSHREAGVARICRALAALREAAGVSAADLLDQAGAIERDPLEFGPERFVAERGARISDLRRLKAAVYLTPLLPPPLS